MGTCDRAGASGWPTPAPTSLISVWQTEQGLPQNHVTAIAQTRDGYLWIGTYEGLARFDGVRFVTYHAVQHRGLPSSRVTSLFEDAQGALWIGHEHGQVSRHWAGAFETVLSDAPGARGSVIAVQSDPAGDIWALRRSGVAERVRDRWAVAGVESAAWPVLCFQGEKIGGGVAGLWRAQGGLLTALKGSSAGVDGASALDYGRTNGFVMNAAPARDGWLWVVAGTRLRKWKPGGSDVDLGPAPWGDTPVSQLLEAAGGELWVGTQERGLYVRRRDGEYERLSRTNGLPSDWIRSLAEDREGTIWIGTGGGGLCAVRPRRVQMLSPPDEWQGRGLLSVSPGRSEDVWVGTEGAGLYRFVGTEVQRFGPAQGLANAYVWAVLDDGVGPVYAGTWGGGLFVRKGDGGWGSIAGLNDDGFVVTALHRGRGGKSGGPGPLWVGTQRGLVRVDAQGMTWIGREFRSPEVRSIAETVDGAVWFGMAGGGLGRWRAGELRQFAERDGLPALDVWALCPEEDGTLWIGTVGGGICRWKNGRFATIDDRAGLPNSVVCQILDDGHGAFWLGTRGGIVRVSRQELADCADGRLAMPAFFTYGRADGLATLECSGGSQPSGGRMADGRLLFPTTRGLAVIDPGGFTTNLVAPPVLIESVSIGGIPAWVGGTNAGPIWIPPGSQRVDFRFTGLSFVAPERMRFRYRLEGLEEGWTELSGTRTVGYTRVPPGRYVFRATACNSDGIWNSEGATLAVVVLPYFWQAWWFQIGVVVCAAAGVGLGVRFLTRRRYRRKLERIERQRAIERERSRIARDIHDDLGASLTRITLLSDSASDDLGDPTMTAGHLQRIGAISRDITKALEEIVWAINPRHDTLDSLATYLGRFAQDLSSAAGLRCRIDIPTRLPPWPLSAEFRHNLFLGFKEALHNVVRHAGARQVNVVLQMAPHGFTLSVEDDGRGFEPTSGQGPEAAASGHARGVGGNGLQNMTRRLEEIGGRCIVESRPGAGAVVRFVVKIHDNPSGEKTGKVTL